MAANSMATSCMGAQVKAFSTRSDWRVVIHDTSAIQIKTKSRNSPLTGNVDAEADGNRGVAVPQPARQHRQRDDEQIEQIVLPLDADWRRRAGCALEAAATRGSRPCGRSRRTARAGGPLMNSMGSSMASNVQRKSTPLRKPRKSGGSPSGVSEPPIFETRKIKNTNTWTLCRRVLVGADHRADQHHRSAGRAEKLADKVPAASIAVLVPGVPTKIAADADAAGHHEQRERRRMNGRYSSSTVCKSARDGRRQPEGERRGHEQRERPEEGDLAEMMLPEMRRKHRQEGDGEQQPREGEPPEQAEPCAVEMVCNRDGVGAVCKPIGSIRSPEMCYRRLSRPSSAVALRRGIVVGGQEPCALLESLFQRHRPVIFAQEVGEGLLGQRIEARAGVARQKLERLQQPGTQADELTFDVQPVRGRGHAAEHNRFFAASAPEREPRATHNDYPSQPL